MDSIITGHPNPAHWGNHLDLMIHVLVKEVLAEATRDQRDDDIPCMLTAMGYRMLDLLQQPQSKKRGRDATASAYRRGVRDERLRASSPPMCLDRLYARERIGASIYAYVPSWHGGCPSWGWVAKGAMILPVAGPKGDLP